MKLEEYECVKTKRRAQARIYEQTKDLTPEQLVAHTSASVRPPASGRPSCAPALKPLRNCNHGFAKRDAGQSSQPHRNQRRKRSLPPDPGPHDQKERICLSR